MILIGRLLVLAVGKLNTIDFAPRALRAAPKQAASVDVRYWQIVAKIVLPTVSKILRAAGAVFV
jgi:hypothetical protein